MTHSTAHAGHQPLETAPTRLRPIHPTTTTTTIAPAGRLGLCRWCHRRRAERCALGHLKQRVDLRVAAADAAHQLERRARRHLVALEAEGEAAQAGVCAAWALGIRRRNRAA
jgi:hypothetical protein